VIKNIAVIAADSKIDSSVWDAISFQFSLTFTYLDKSLHTETERRGELLFICCCLLLREGEPTFSLLPPVAPGSRGSQTPQKIAAYRHGTCSPVQLGGKDEHFWCPAVPSVSIYPLNVVCSCGIRGLHM